MDERKYTSGEIAAAAGLSIRAVQHYDNIGLLRSAGRTEGGRRYYTQADLIQLQQIVLYKSLGFSLEQIKKNLLFEPNRDELLEVFKNQQLLLLQKIEHLHTSFVALSIMSDRVQEEKEVPLMLFLQFFSALPGDDIFARANQMLDEQQADLSLHFGDLEQTRQFYHKWKEVLIEAMLLLHENLSPESQEAQDLVKRWWDAVIAYTGGDMALIKQLSELKPMEIISANLLGVDVVSIFLRLFVAIQIGREFQEGSIESYLSAAPKRRQYCFAKASIFFLIALIIGIIVALVTLMNGKLLVSVLNKPMPESDTIRQFVAGCIVMPVFYSLLAVCASFIAKKTAAGIVLPASVLFLPIFSKLLPKILQSLVVPVLPSSAIHTLSGIATKNSMEYSGMIGAVLILGIWIFVFATR